MRTTAFFENEIYLYDCTWFYKVTEEGVMRYETDNQYTAIYSAFDGLYGLKKDGHSAKCGNLPQNLKNSVCSGVTHKQLAERSGLSQQNISMYKSNGSKRNLITARLNAVIRLAEALNCHVEDLI